MAACFNPLLNHIFSWKSYWCGSYMYGRSLTLKNNQMFITRYHKKLVEAWGHSVSMKYCGSKSSKSTYLSLYENLNNVIYSFSFHRSILNWCTWYCVSSLERHSDLCLGIPKVQRSGRLSWEGTPVRSVCKANYTVTWCQQVGYTECDKNLVTIKIQ